MPETGEQLRICPDKEAEEVRRYWGQTGPVVAPGGMPDGAHFIRATRFKPKTEQELSCPSDCPGATRETRTLFGGRIRLPSIFDVEVCPLKQLDQ